MPSVWPSGAAFSMPCMPMMPPPPAMFSTTTGEPSCWDSFSPTRRLVRSRMPPAELGAMMRTGLDGKAEAAGAGAASIAARLAAAARMAVLACLMVVSFGAGGSVQLEGVLRHQLVPFFVFRAQESLGFGRAAFHRRGVQAFGVGRGLGAGVDLGDRLAEPAHDVVGHVGGRHQHAGRPNRKSTRLDS